MGNQVGQCPSCNAQALIKKASRLECSWCGYVEDIAAYELSKPGLSPDARQFWTLVGVAAVFVGLFKLAEYVERLA